MSLRINNNVEAFNTHRQLVSTAAKAAKSMERLSSGYRINRAADDAAGLAISEKMRGQITGLAGRAAPRRKEWCPGGRGVSWGVGTHRTPRSPKGSAPRSPPTSTGLTGSA